PCPSISITGRAATWVRLAARGDDEFLGANRISMRGEDEVLSLPRGSDQRLFQAQYRATAVEDQQECLEDVLGSIADGKDLARLFDFGGHAFRLDERHQVTRPKGAEGRMEESPAWTVFAHDTSLVRIVRQVTARATRHEDLDPRPLILFKE